MDNWYNTNEPFNLEVEIIDESKRAEVEDKILRAVFKGSELIDGLRINMAYKQSLDRQTVLSSQMKDEFEEIMRDMQDKFDRFFKKWDCDENPELRGAINQGQWK